jgi:hypothetical protein
MLNRSEPPNVAATKTPISQEVFDQLFREARLADELRRSGPTVLEPMK